MYIYIVHITITITKLLLIAHKFFVESPYHTTYSIQNVVPALWQQTKQHAQQHPTDPTVAPSTSLLRSKNPYCIAESGGKNRKGENKSWLKNPYCHSAILRTPQLKMVYRWCSVSVTKASIALPYGSPRNILKGNAQSILILGRKSERGQGGKLFTEAWNALL